MSLKECISKHKSSVTAVAAVCNVTQSAASQWIANNHVPAEHCPTIEKFFKGDIRCEDMNKKVDWTYLRKTARKPRPRAVAA